MKSKSTSILGVGKRKGINKDRWYASIVINGKSIHLGSFYDFETARNARLIAETIKHDMGIF